MSKDNRDMENWLAYRADNRQSWNARTPVHITSAMYDVPGFLAGASSLKAPERSLLGDVHGLDILHLQCHFGQDTLSLARMGARVCGVDFSEVAIEEARKLAEATGVHAQFLCCDVYELDQYFGGSGVDLVFVSYGALCWLPDLYQWARLVHHVLRPGGRLVLVEFHPTLYMIDFPTGTLGYPYFSHAEPITEETIGTYADQTSGITTLDHFWSHPISEVLDALLRAGCRLETFREWDYSPWNCFEHMREDAPGEFRYGRFAHPLPHLYGLTAVRD